MPALKYIFTDDVIRHHRDDVFYRLGNMIVDRFDQLETSIERCPRLYQGTLVMLLVEIFVHGNFPISQVDVPFFRNSV
jgi:hypothetical protein